MAPVFFCQTNKLLEKNRLCKAREKMVGPKETVSLLVRENQKTEDENRPIKENDFENVVLL